MRAVAIVLVAAALAALPAAAKNPVPHKPIALCGAARCIHPRANGAVDVALNYYLGWRSDESLAAPAPRPAPWFLVVLPDRNFGGVLARGVYVPRARSLYWLAVPWPGWIRIPTYEAALIAHATRGLRARPAPARWRRY